MLTYLKNRKRINCFFGVLIILFISQTNVMAIEFLPLDNIAISQGGAGVASASSSFGTYYNPALLSKHLTGFEWITSVGIGIREMNLADHIDELSDIDVNDTIDDLEIAIESIPYKDDDNNNDYDTLFNKHQSIQLDKPGLQTDLQTIKKELRLISDENALQLSPNLSVAFQMGNFGIGMFSMSELTASAIIDKNKLDYIVEATFEQSGVSETEFMKYADESDSLTIVSEIEYSSKSLEHALNNYDTYLHLIGITYYEIPIAYGRTMQTPLGGLSLGASFKFMIGYTYEKDINIDTETGDIQDEFDDGSEHQDTTFGFDAGLLFAPKMFNNRLLAGLVVKNLNSPKFETKSGAEYTLDPQIRAGLTYHLWKDTLMFSFDYDISENETLLDDYKVQNMGGGVYFKPTNWTSLRCGVQQNMSQSEEDTLLTAGIAFGLKWFKLDLAGQYSTETTEYDGNEIPRSARVQLSLISNLFYGSQDDQELAYEKIDQRDIAEEIDDIPEEKIQPVEETQEPVDQDDSAETQVAVSDALATSPTVVDTIEESMPEQAEPEAVTETLPVEKLEQAEPEIVTETTKTDQTEPEPVTPSTLEKTKPTPCPTNDAASKLRETINVTNSLNKWTKSWSSMDVDAYLSMYGDEFKPPKGMSRSAWEKQRHKRLKKKFITINISNVSINFTDCSIAEIRFDQDYASPGYKDQTRKLLIFQKVDMQWLIIKEQSIK
jgi:hypothetical protein